MDQQRLGRLLSSFFSGGGGGFGGGGGIAPPSFFGGRGIPVGSHTTGVGHSTGFLNWLGSKSELAGRELLAGLPMTYHIVDTLGNRLVDSAQHPFVHGERAQERRQEWSDLFHGHILRAMNERQNPRWSGAMSPSELAASKIAGGFVGQYAKIIHDPIGAFKADPFGTTMAVLPITHGLGKFAEVTRVPGFGAGPRVFHAGEKEVRLVPSRNPSMRAAQRTYDTVVRRSLRQGPGESRLGNALYGHAQRRIGNALREGEIIQQRLNALPANALDLAAHKLLNGRFNVKAMARGLQSPGAKAVARDKQAALELTGVNTTPRDAALYHAAQALKGVNKDQNAAVAQIYERLDRRGWLAQDENGHVVINAHRAPKGLAETDAALAAATKQAENTLVTHNIYTREGLDARIDNPAKVRAGAQYVEPTPAKQGFAPAADAATAAYLKAQKAYNDALDKEEEWRQSGGAQRTPGGKLVTPPLKFEASNPFRDEVLKTGLDLEKTHKKMLHEIRMARTREEPTGFVGGETALPGKRFVSYGMFRAKRSGLPVSAQRGPTVVGMANPRFETFRGGTIEEGNVPTDVTGQTASHVRHILKLDNTRNALDQALQTGSLYRRSNRDIQVRMHDEPRGQISQDYLQAVGAREPTGVGADQPLSPEEEHGLFAAQKAYVEGRIPSLWRGADQHLIGQEADQGHFWVDRSVIDKLLPNVHSLGNDPVTRAVHDVNSAITAATVYLRPGHMATRFLTNAGTNIIQGSANPLQVGRSLLLWRAMSETEKRQSLAIAGEAGFSALPASASRVGRIAGRGAQWWARRVDSPFRFNSLMYELGRAGYRSLPQIRDALNGIQRRDDPVALEAAQRANREAIAYDRLSDWEKNYISRYIWFYPWVKSSTTWAVRSMIDHPYKSAVLGSFGQQGQQRLHQLLGDVPTYEAGVIPSTPDLSGHAGTYNISTFSPVSTLADMMFLARRPQGLLGMANPVTGAILASGEQLPRGTSAYQAALEALISSTAPGQLAADWLHPSKATSIFQRTPGSTAKSYFIGPWWRRSAYVPALNRAYGAEQSNRP